MKNEYGEVLDRNGYVQSIVNRDRDTCHMCEAELDIVRHEVFEGIYRHKSKRYGMWINICPYHHNLLHSKPKLMTELKQDAQRAAMEHYGWTMEEWRLHFGKNWL